MFSLVATAGAVAGPTGLRLSGDVVFGDSQAAVLGATYSLTLSFDALARNHSSDPGRGLYGGRDALITGFDFTVHAPGGQRFQAGQPQLAPGNSNSLVSVVDDPRGDSWYMTLFGQGLRLAAGDNILADYRLSVELEGGTTGVTSSALGDVPQAAAFSSALMGFFRSDGSPVLIATVDRMEAVTAVPEPATWLLMLAGVGALGQLARRPGAAGFTPRPPAAS
ncbi:PEP-CTERM sorting domain-containing protein [Aquincola tertiaricarbonis]|uniref:PEP-CTERM sorting domain-containing protein n=1 Tax=Aquincola tertiaricarbonis TaxID=391953 RepID=A0ABY4SED8_AQUTE|nr:PEP-CTERM sorting domain-containing protein [Aquincola tertiaricarbonis]URI11686.1 PEP-CTERM sorting domain-containing protein [Aquincola tertiaricarbonis]